MCNLLSSWEYISVYVCVYVCAKGNNHKEPSSALLLFWRIEAITLKGKNEIREGKLGLGLRLFCHYFPLFYFISMTVYISHTHTHTHTNIHPHAYTHTHTWAQKREEGKRRNQQISAAYFRTRELLILVFFLHFLPLFALHVIVSVFISVRPSVWVSMCLCVCVCV